MTYYYYYPYRCCCDEPDVPFCRLTGARAQPFATNYSGSGDPPFDAESGNWNDLIVSGSVLSGSGALLNLESPNDVGLKTAPPMRMCIKLGNVTNNEGGARIAISGFTDGVNLFTSFVYLATDTAGAVTIGDYNLTNSGQYTDVASININTTSPWTVLDVYLVSGTKYAFVLHNESGQCSRADYDWGVLLDGPGIGLDTTTGNTANPIPGDLDTGIDEIVTSNIPDPDTCECPTFCSQRCANDLTQPSNTNPVYYGRYLTVTLTSSIGDTRSITCPKTEPIPNPPPGESDTWQQWEYRYTTTITGSVGGTFVYGLTEDCDFDTEQEAGTTTLSSTVEMRTRTNTATTSDGFNPETTYEYGEWSEWAETDSLENTYTSYLRGGSCNGQFLLGACLRSDGTGPSFDSPTPAIQSTSDYRAWFCSYSESSTNSSTPSNTCRSVQPQSAYHLDVKEYSTLTIDVELTTAEA